MLFIIIHQASELWMKLCLHELTAARDHIRRDDLGPSFKMLARVSRIQAQLVQSWDVLATMTPAEYSMFRNQLGRASGFQSMQYRMLEFVIGNKNAEMIQVHRARAGGVRSAAARAANAEHLRRVAAPAEPARLRDPGGVPGSRLVAALPAEQAGGRGVAGRVSQRRCELGSVRAGGEAGRPRPQFQLWRFSHMKTVERIIGYKRGTGGTGGVSYLTKALELRFFPELWSIRTSM